MKLFSAKWALLLIIAYYAHEWTNVKPRVEWKLSSQTEFQNCADPNVPKVFLCGATSMLGRYLVENLKSSEDICLISFARSNCKTCDINIKGDLRDARLLERSFQFYKPETVITAVKPPLLHVHYKTYIEINLLSIVQLVDIAKKNSAKNFIYVSSIAAAGHYFNHVNSTEAEPKPFYTDFEAAYDVSKRFAEDYILRANDESFRTVSIRVGGIMGGVGDPYEYLRLPLPVMFALWPPPPRVDSNYAGNVGEAVRSVFSQLQTLPGNSLCKFCGEFYYFTGEPLSETEKVEIIAELTGKVVLYIPKRVMEWGTEFLYWMKFDPNIYNGVDYARMGLIPQTFNQNKFHSTFTNFKPQMSLRDALKKMYSSTVVDASNSKTEL